MFGWQRTLTAEQTAEIAAAKQVIYDGFRKRLRAACRKTRPEFSWMSSSVRPFCATRHARSIITACPAEKSGQDEFDFEYGEDFAAHIESFRSDVLQSAGALQSGRRSRIE